MATKALGRYAQKDIDFAVRIESYMKLKGLNSRKLAEKVYFSHSTHYKRLNSPDSMTVGELRSYIRILDIPREDVLNMLYLDGGKL